MISKTSHFVCLVITCMLISCNSDNSAKDYKPVFATGSTKKNVLVFGLPTISQYADPLAEYLNNHLKDISVKLIHCLSYEDYLDKLQKRQFDFTIINGIEALKAEKNGYIIFGKLADDTSYRSVIVVKKGSNIKKVTDLKNKLITIPGNTRVAGTMMGLSFLYENGLDVNRDLKRIPVPSFESAIVNTYLGKSDAGISLLRNWKNFKRDNPEMVSQLEIKWETPTSVNNALVIKKEIGKNSLEEIKNLLFSLQNSKEGLNVLQKFGTTAFKDANSETYIPLKQFYDKYAAVIH